MSRPGFAFQAADGESDTLSVIQGDDGYVVFVITSGEESRSIRFATSDEDAEAIATAVRKCAKRTEAGELAVQNNRRRRR